MSLFYFNKTSPFIHLHTFLLSQTIQPVFQKPKSSTKITPQTPAQFIQKMVKEANMAKYFWKPPLSISITVNSVSLTEDTAQSQ